MCQKATIPAGVVLLGVLALHGIAAAQPAGGSASPDWRRIGNSAVELFLASPATGPVDRVWYSADGSRLFAKARSGGVFETSDFEKWQPSTATPPEAESVPPAGSLPEGARAARALPASALRLYAFGGQVFRSDDGGRSWANVTAYKRESIIGGGMTDLAVSPRDQDELTVANEFGVWRSLDGGASWAGLNDSLPNLPVRRILELPQASRGLRIAADGLGGVEWAPGEKHSWHPAPDAQDEGGAARRAASQSLGTDITALVSAGDTAYAGSADGRLWVSNDRGRNWTPAPAPQTGPVEGLFADSKEPRIALAAIGATAGGRAPHVLRTMNGGLFWDDVTSNLPASAAYAVTADLATGTVYAATDRGVFFSRTDLFAAGPAPDWVAASGNLPAAPALDVRLDASGNQLFVALRGYGVYATLAPHRVSRLRLVNAADLSQRPAAPGSLVSVLGGRVDAAKAGDLNFPVLTATATESQIQVPFEARGRSLSLAVEAGSSRVVLGVPLQEVSPAIFVDRDGTPLLLNADTGVLLDAMNTARPGGRVQVLATGLGNVRPDWPTGMPGPMDNPPQVIAPVHAYFDGIALEVTKAVLAPGYIGLYLVEFQLPAIVNAGPAELYLEADGQQSNRVRIYTEP